MHKINLLNEFVLLVRKVVCELFGHATKQSMLGRPFLIKKWDPDEKQYSFWRDESVRVLI